MPTMFGHKRFTYSFGTILQLNSYQTIAIRTRCNIPTPIILENKRSAHFFTPRIGQSEFQWRFNAFQANVNSQAKFRSRSSVRFLTISQWFVTLYQIQLCVWNGKKIQKLSVIKTSHFVYKSVRKRGAKCGCA